jgi:hypothetical protein
MADISSMHGLPLSKISTPELTRRLPMLKVIIPILASFKVRVIGVDFSTYLTDMPRKAVLLISTIE